MTRKIFQSSKKLDQPELVLVAIYELQKKIGREIRETTLHHVLYELRNYAHPPFKFITRPTIYISQLGSNLMLLEKRNLISETMLIHNERIPRYYYSLTKYGEAETKDLIEKIMFKKANSFERILSHIDSYFDHMNKDKSAKHVRNGKEIVRVDN